MNLRISLLAAALLVGCAPTDEDQDGFTADVDCDDNDNLVFPGGNEICDGIDNDCNGILDDAYASGGVVFYADADGDGFGAARATAVACTAPVGFVPDASDCNDDDGSIFPGADEFCNSLDDNCNGRVDDDAVDSVTWHADWDQDGFGSQTLVARACDAPDGYIEDSSDCNDFDVFINPNALEYCDFVDNDCDDVVDEDDAEDAREWYLDADSDGHGDITKPKTACWQPDGHAALDDDCDDTTNQVHPDMPEICRDGVDNNCNESGDQCSVKAWGDAKSTSALSWSGRGSSSYLGYSVRFAGDVNGDGFDDIVAGAYYDYDGSDYGQGAAYIFYGEDGYDFNEVRSSGDEAAFAGESRYYYTGYSVGPAGDVNADGYDDVIIAAYGANSYRGRAYLVYGQADKFTGRQKFSDEVYWEGPSSYYYLGYTVHGAGDQDGDGYDDIAFGTYREGSYNGAVFLVYGQSDKFTGSNSAYDSDAYFVGPGSSNYLGYVNSLGEPRDFDGDGLEDIIIGAYRANGFASYSGKSWIVYGEKTRWSGKHSANDLEDSVGGSSTYQYLGYGNGGLGDVNDDGYPDMGVGCYGCAGYSGSLFVFFGSATRLGEVADTDADATLVGTSRAYMSMYGSPASGDFDGDGIDDIAVGGYAHNSYRGGIFVLTGSASLGGEYLAADGDMDTIIEGPTGGSSYLGRGAGAGDFNGDGYTDLVGGAYYAGGSLGHVYMFEGTAL